MIRTVNCVKELLVRIWEYLFIYLVPWRVSPVGFACRADWNRGKVTTPEGNWQDTFERSPS